MTSYGWRTVTFGPTSDTSAKATAFGSACTDRHWLQRRCLGSLYWC